MKCETIIKYGEIFFLREGLEMNLLMKIIQLTLVDKLRNIHAQKKK